MPAAVAEEFTHCASRVRRQVKHGSRLGSRGRDNNCVVHGPVVFQDLDHLRDGRTLLSDGAVNTDQVVALIVDDGVQNDGSLASLAVTNDKFALPTTNGNHGVNGLDAGGHRLTHGLTINYARSNALDVNILFSSNGPLIVDGLAQRIYYAPDQSRSRRHGHNVPGALDFIAFLHFRVIAEQHRAHLVFFQVHGDAGNTMAEVEQLAGHDFVQTVEAGDAVPERDNRSHFVHRDLGLVILNLFAY